MRKNLAILLISFHLVGNTEVGQVFKLPRLLDHFKKHHQQNPSVSFIDFIIMHYAGDDGTSSDDDQDQQLPCHNLHHNTMGMVYSPMVKTLPDNNIFLWETRSYISYFSGPIPTIPLTILLQPPRQA